MHKIEGEIYDLYQGHFKDIYADLCIVRGNKPAQIAFEIEAAFSHLSVAKLNSDDAELYEKNLNRAKGHIERAILDAVKILWLEYHNRLVNVVQDPGLRQFCVNCSEAEFIQSFHQAEAQTIEARKVEIDNVGKDPLASIAMYYDAAKSMQETLMKVDEVKKANFSKFSFGNFIKTQAAGLIIGIMAGLITGYVFM